MFFYGDLASLVRDLGFSARTLYSITNRPWKYYRKKMIPKGNGESRQLYVPNSLLKAVQRRIVSVLLCKVPISPYATAYHQGGSTLENAAPHVGQRFVLKLDITHFFDSITYSQVKNCVFRAGYYSEPLRVLLTMLCVYSDGLPQGAPTSPAISNIILTEFDYTVGAWCTQRQIKYSRYCDDMTFSGEFDTEDTIRFVRGELRKMGFFLNDKKTHIAHDGQRKKVTGIVVNDYPSAPADYRREIRQEVYYCRKYGVSSHLLHSGLNVSETHYYQSLLGRIIYANTIKDSRELHEYADWVRRQLKQCNTKKHEALH